MFHVKPMFHVKQIKGEIKMTIYQKAIKLRKNCERKKTYVDCNYYCQLYLSFLFVSRETLIILFSTFHL